MRKRMQQPEKKKNEQQCFVKKTNKSSYNKMFWCDLQKNFVYEFEQKLHIFVSTVTSVKKFH